MKVLISGASGMVGRDLKDHLSKAGHQITRLVRSGSESTADGPAIRWNPETGEANSAEFEGFDAVIHLAGENISEGRWTEAKKRRIRDSRVIPTKNLARLLSNLSRPPATFICASAIGYYGDRGAEELVELSAPGTGFLPTTCQEWEQNSMEAGKKGIRVVNLRFGIILSAKGGALAKMLTPFKIGVGGKIGSGEQYMSWVALPEVVAVIEHAIVNQELKGPVNVVSPQPVTNGEFTKALGAALSRPTIFPMPAFAAKLAFGEMADALLLASARVLPDKLKKSGYRFRYPDLKQTLTSLLS